jgi:glycosyltransferase involved in cell wall biosynthesis
MTNKNYVFDVVAADDGSGDQLLQFSEEFLADNDWRVDDVISFDMQEDKSIILKNKTWEARNESLSKQIPLPLDQPLQDS